MRIKMKIKYLLKRRGEQLLSAVRSTLFSIFMLVCINVV